MPPRRPFIKITARVKSLESQLGSTLFIRNRAGARLTADGEAFVVYANQLQAQDLPLTIGISLTIAAVYVLANILVDLLHLWVDPRQQGKTA